MRPVKQVNQELFGNAKTRSTHHFCERMCMPTTVVTRFSGSVDEICKIRVHTVASGRRYPVAGAHIPKTATVEFRKIYDQMTMYASKVHNYLAGTRHFANMYVRYYTEVVDVVIG